MFEIDWTPDEGETKDISFVDNIVYPFLCHLEQEMNKEEMSIHRIEFDKLRK